MLIIYYLSDGEVHNVAIGWKNLQQYYGRRAEEMSRIFGSIYIPFDKYVYDHHYLFKYNVKTNKLEFKSEPPAYIQSLIQKKDVVNSEN